MSRIHLLPILALASACTLREPTPTGIPFVSDQIVGHWYGKWNVALPGQNGRAEVLCVTQDGVVDWQMWLQGGLFSGPDDNAYFHLTGPDGIDNVQISGDGPQLGHIDMSIDKRGIAKGTSYPATMGPVPIVGIVGEDYIRLDFLLLEVVHGKAIVTFEGLPAEDADTDGNPFADTDADSDADTDAAE